MNRADSIMIGDNLLLISQQLQTTNQALIEIIKIMRDD